MRIRHIAVRFALILAIAAVVPLAGYGIWSLVTLQRGTRDSVVAGNQNVAARAAEEIRRYVFSNADILKALSADLQNTGLEAWQQDRIVKNYVLQFHEFRELTLVDEAGAVVATSRIGTPRLNVPTATADYQTIGGVLMSPIRIDEDLLPTSTFAIHLQRLNQPAGWLLGELSLEEMWRMVDRIRIGQHGFALVVAPDQTLLAHGDPDRKALVAQGRKMSAHPLIAGPTLNAPWREYDDDQGIRQLAVAAPIDALKWTVIVEQSTDEAYQNAARLTRQLMVAAGAALAIMVVVGLLFGRRFIAPIFALQRGTQAIAEGKLETRVSIPSIDEFGQLGASFNSMADRLVQLQEDVKREERQAMFGRVVAGLFHDLNHPIQNIGNNARLLVRDDQDATAKRGFQASIERELATLKRFMDDVLSIGPGKQRPLEKFTFDVSPALKDIVDAMQAEGERAGISVAATLASDPLLIEADRFGLQRVFRNLITNAIQATAAGGRVTATTAREDGDSVVVRVADTGSGIAPDRLAAIFDDFVTTKKRGLGLGLATSKRIVEQLGGTIEVASELGRGTTFSVRFRSADSRTEAAAS